MRIPVRLPALTADQLAELDSVYRTTQDRRVRTRAQIILLAAEKGLIAPQIAEIVRSSDQTVRNCLKRYMAKGIAGLQDAMRSGRPGTMTTAYQDQLILIVRRRPRSLDLPFSMWTCQRLADYMAQQTDICVSEETVRRCLAAEGIVLSRPQHKISSPDPEYLVKKDD
jgi:transposase